MGATAAHRAPKGVADGTCTQIEAWMTNKCRMRINERDIYIYVYNNRDLPKRGEEEKEKPKERGERLLGCERSWEFTSSGERSLLPRTSGRLVQCIFHHQNRPSPDQSSTFGPTLYKFIVMGPV